MRIQKLCGALFFFVAIGNAHAQIPDNLVQFIHRPSMYADQAILELIPQIDPLYHQYVFPAFHKMTALSHRIRTMPEIARWRGKVPTRIAPEVQGKDPYNWQYLSPYLYIYLMPEMWPSFYRETQPVKPTITRQINWKNPKEAQRAFDASEQRMAIQKEIQQRAQINAEGGLTEQDKQAVYQVFSDLVEFSKTREGKAVFAHVVVALDSDKIYDAMARPCASMVQRMHEIQMESFLTPALDKAQLSEKDFIEKCERVTRAYRVAHSSPEMAMYIIRLQRKLKRNPSAKEAVMWKALIDMFSVSVADVQSVLPEKNKWQKLFSQQRPLFLGTPFILDF